DRSRQYPARFALGAGPRGPCAARDAETCVRRRPRQDRRALRLRCGDRRRRYCHVDRRRLDHRQGDARPPDERIGAGLPGLRLRKPQGLRRAGTSRGAGPVRPEHPPPPVFRAGHCRAAETLSRDRRRDGRTRSLHRRRRDYFRDFSDDLRPVASAARAHYQTSWGQGGSARAFGRFMRFTSLVVELIRARPRLVVWIVVLLQAALWLILPTLLYRSPPGDLATVLAFGREYQVGTWFGPPLAFWLADIAYRAVGNHIFGVYLLAQICAVVTFWSFYHLARAIVGGQQAVIAVLLSMTVVAFSSPGVEFGPLVLARPLWALLLLHSWQLIGQNRRNAWFAWSIEAGLLLLTTSAAPGLLLLLAGFAVATARGRRVLMSLDPLYALLVIVVLVLPYLIWLLRADALAMPPWPAISDLGSRAMQWGWLLASLVLAMSAIVLLVILNSGWFVRDAGEAPIIYRPSVDPLARDFVYFFAIAPALLGSFLAGLFN